MFEIDHYGNLEFMNYYVFGDTSLLGLGILVSCWTSNGYLSLVSFKY